MLSKDPPPNTSVKGIQTWKSELCMRKRPCEGAQPRRSPSALAIEIFEARLGSHILQSLDDFVFALNQEGKFLYISETISQSPHMMSTKSQGVPV